MLYIKSVLTNMYSSILRSYEDVKSECEYEIFYEHACVKLKYFQAQLKNIPENEINEMQNNGVYFKSLLTKKRLINLVNQINDICLKILQAYYKGNLWAAGECLNNLLLSKGKIKIYLEDDYLNYFTSSMLADRVYYRMRDCKKKEIPLDCWHVPYEKRSDAVSARYSIASFPSLYLSDSKKTANKELGKLRKGYHRWVAEFNLKSDMKVFLFDLRIPENKVLEKATPIELFNFIITFPVRFLCSAKTFTVGACEEYYFPQLICHWLLCEKNKRMSFNGIVYNSTVNTGGLNYVFPAFYNGTKPVKGFSPLLFDLFTMTVPQKYSK